MHGQDHRMRRVGLPGNVCHAALRLGACLNIELLRQRLASPALDWLARVRIIRPVPVLPPLWRTASRPRAIFFEHTSSPVLPSIVKFAPDLPSGASPLPGRERPTSVRGPGMGHMR